MTSVQIFDTVDGFLEAAYRPTTFANSFNESWWREHRDYISDPKWFGMRLPSTDRVLSYKDVEKLIADGWTEGLAMVVEFMERLDVPVVPSVRRRLVWTDQGDHIEMPKVWNGQLDTAWQIGRRRSAHGPRTVRIAVDACGGSDSEAKNMVWRGIASMALADTLIEAGHNVELMTTFKVHDTSDNVYTTMIVTKGALMPMDMASVAATTAFVGFFRHAGLCYLWTRYSASDYGNCGGPARMRVQDLPEYGATDRFLAGREICNAEAAQQWVNDSVKAFVEGPNIIQL